MIAAVLFIVLGGCTPRGCLSGNPDFPAESGGENNNGNTGGVPGAPTRTTVSIAQGSFSSIVSSGTYRAWIGVSPISGSGAGGFSSGNRYEMSDPFLETGVEQVMGKAK